MPKDFHICLGLRDAALLQDVTEKLKDQFTITALHEGHDILNCILEFQPDLALLDAGIPEIDVLTLCEKMYADYPLIRIVLYVGLESLADMKRKWRKRAMDYSIGPLEAEELYADILKVVRYICVEREREQLKRQRIEMDYYVTQALVSLKKNILSVAPESLVRLRPDMISTIDDIVRTVKDKTNLL